MMRTLLRIASTTTLATVVAAISAAGGGRLPAAASRLPATSGSAATGIMVQSLLAAQPIELLAQLRLHGLGGNAVAIPRNGVEPGAAAPYWLSGEPSLAPGLHGVRIRGTDGIAAMARTDWFANGAASATNGVVPATDVVLPLVTLGHYGQTSQIAIQNAGDTGTAAVNIAWHAADSGGIVATQRVDIPQGAAVELVPPAAVAASGTTGTGFIGSLRATSTVSVAVQAFVDMAHGYWAVYGVEGVPAAMASEVLFAPFVQRIDGGSAPPAHTALVVSNVGDAPADVQVTYRGTSGPCAGQSIAHDLVTIGGRASHVFSQRADPTHGDKNHLPNGCRATASARSAGGRLTGVVLSFTGAMRGAASYAAVGLADVERDVAVPLVRSCFHSQFKIATFVTLMNTGTTRTVVDMEGIDPQGKPLFTCGPACGIPIEPLAAEVFSLRDSPACDPNPGFGRLGSARFTALQPLAVVVQEFSMVGALDPVMYNGMPASPSRAVNDAWFPMAARAP